MSRETKHISRVTLNTTDVPTKGILIDVFKQNAEQSLIKVGTLVVHPGSIVWTAANKRTPKYVDWSTFSEMMEVLGWKRPRGPKHERPSPNSNGSFGKS